MSDACKTHVVSIGQTQPSSLAYKLATIDSDSVIEFLKVYVKAFRKLLLIIVRSLICCMELPNPLSQK